MGTLRPPTAGLRAPEVLALACAAVHALALLGSASAATHIVPDQYATVQAAIDAAASGDSVFVRAGTYVEALTLAGKDLTLAGEAGPDSTVLTTNSTGRILDIGAGVTTATVISGFQFLNGSAESGAAAQISAGASPIFRRCAFASNVVYKPNGTSTGGAVAAIGAGPVFIEDCKFLGNRAYTYFDGAVGLGGAIFGTDGVGITIRRSLFRTNFAQGFEGGPGAAMYFSQTPAVVESCSIALSSGAYGAISSSNATLAVRDCIFDSNHVGYGASAVYVNGAGSEVVRSVFVGNISPSGSVIESFGGRAVLTANTIAFNGGSFAVSVDSRSQLRRNIIANNTYGMDCAFGAPSVFQCNDVWGNSGGNYGSGCVDPTGINGNISADPLFCEAAVRDLRLRGESPCAPGASACGLIGALGVACLTGVSVGTTGPWGVALDPIAPNPSSVPIRIGFEVSRQATLRLEIFDTTGRRCGVLAQGSFGPGRYVRIWSSHLQGPAPRPGVYLAVLQDGSHRTARRFIVIK